MVKPKKKVKTREELLARKRENEKKRYLNIKKNPQLYAESKRKSKEKYEKKKREGKIKNIRNLPPREQRALKKKWRDQSKKAYQLRKEKKAAIQIYMTSNSPPNSDIEEAALQNFGNLRPNEPENLPGCSRSVPQVQQPCSPMSSPVSSPGSSACASPRARQILRKLRYKKDKEIESLRTQLQSVKKLNDMYRKQLSRQQKRNVNSSPVAQSTRSTSSPMVKESQFDLSDNHSDDSRASALCRGILQSYKNITSSKMKSNKTIRVVKKEKMVTSPKQAIEIYETKIVIFLKHTGMVVSQQQAINKIKTNLQTNEALVHIDFSENYKCAFSHEIQAAHFGGSKPQISIHTSVLYFFDSEGKRRTQCFASISSNLRHDAAAVGAHMEPI